MKQELTKNEKVHNYITEHPGITKTGVVKAMDGIYSRVTVLNSIKDLINMKILLEKKNKPNSQTHYLFLNDEHPINSITAEIESVQQFMQSMNEPIKEFGHLLADLDLDKTLESDRFLDTAMSVIFTYRYQLHSIIFVLAHKTFELVHSLNAVRKISQDLVSVMRDVTNQLSDLDHWLTVYRTEKLNRLKEELEQQARDEQSLSKFKNLLEKVTEIMTKVHDYSERFKLIEITTAKMKN